MNIIKQKKKYNGKEAKKLNYLENSKNKFYLKKIVNIFLEESGSNYNKYDYNSHNKIYKSQFEDSNKKVKEKDYYKIDFKKSYCSIHNNSFSPFLNIGQNIIYNCFIINILGNKITNLNNFFSLSNYDFSCSINNNNSKNDSNLKNEYEYKIIKHLTYFSCIFTIKEYGIYSIHAYFNKRNFKIMNEIKSKINNFYCVPSKLFINNSKIFNIYEQNWVNINETIQYKINLEGFITAVDLTTIDGKLGSTYGKIHPNISNININASLFSLHDINYKFIDLEKKIWKYNNKEYIGIFIKKDKDGENLIINSSFDYKIIVLFENIVKFITMKMDLSIKNYKTCFHNLDIKKTNNNFGNNISLIGGQNINIGDIVLRTEYNNLFNYDIGIDNIKFKVYPLIKNIKFRVVSQSIRGIYTVYAYSENDFNGNIKLYLKNKKIKRKLDSNNFKIEFEIKELFSPYQNSTCTNTNFTYIGETINNMIDFNFYLYNYSQKINDSNFFSGSNATFYLYVENERYSNSSCTVNYIKDGLYRFRANIINYNKPTINVWVFDFNNSFDYYNIEFNSTVENVNNTIISNKSTLFYVNDINYKINDYFYINITLKDVKDRFIGKYSQNLSRYKSLISVKAINLVNNNNYKCNFDSLTNNNNTLAYKCNITEEGVYFINVSFDNYTFTNSSTYLLKIPKENFTISLNHSIMEAKVNRSKNVLNTSSIYNLNNNEYIPEFIYSIYNSKNNSLITKYISDAIISCNISDENINFVLKRINNNNSIIFTINDEDINDYKNLIEGNYNLILKINEQQIKYKLKIIGNQKPEGGDEIQVNECYYNCTQCGLPYIMIETYECLDSCPSIDYFNKICKIYSETDNENSKDDIKDEMINEIRNDLLHGKLDTVITEKICEQHDDFILREENVLYQITSSSNQINNKYNNISTINLGECENTIRDHYNMEDDEELIILKIEKYEEGLLIPIIEYEIYILKDNIKVNLSICKDINIELSIPVLINEDELFKYDPNSQFYKDKCFPYTSEDKTDMILSDRNNEFNSKNLSLCENNCEYNGYDLETKKANCKCKTKSELHLTKDINIDKDKLFNKFADIKSSTNLLVIKCFSLLFSKKGLKNNIGSYILLSIFIFFIISLIIFWKIDFNKINSLIENIIKDKINPKLGKNNKEDEKYKHEMKTKKYDENNINNEENIEIKNKINTNKKNKTDIKKKNKKKRKTKNEKFKAGNNNNNYNVSLSSKREFQNSQDLNKPLKDKNINKNSNHNNDIVIHKKSNYSNTIDNLNDKELNTLSYEEALNIDQRTYFEYYLSLLRTKHLIIFTFYPNKNYNSLMIKINLFLLSFALYIVINSLFFNDSTMHKIHEEKGAYNFIYQLPQIIYSTVITAIINIIVKYLSLTENNIIALKQNKSDGNLLSKAFQKTKRCLLIKFIIFFTLDFILIILFWYFLSCFCAVYTNTQIHLIKDTLISFAISLIIPFGINLIPGIFRISSLKNNNKECMYKISKIIQLI